MVKNLPNQYRSDTESTESTESTDSTECTESTESTESIDSTDSTESTNLFSVGTDLVLTSPMDQRVIVFSIICDITKKDRTTYGSGAKKQQC